MLPRKITSVPSVMGCMEGKADIHVHTRYSGLTRVGFLRFPDSVSEPREVVKAAENIHLDVLCVTDHNSIRGGVEAKKVATSVEVVVGSEISTLDGDLLGLFVSEDVSKGLSAEETVDAIHEQSGLAIAPHPFSSHCSSLGLKILDLELDGIELFNAAHRDGYANEAAQTIANGFRTAFVGGSDAHFHTMVGNAYTLFDGRDGEALRKAIVSRRTAFGGESTPLKDLVWMTVNTAAELWRVLILSLLKVETKDGTECAQAVSRMRTISKIVSLMGATAFLTPPTPAVAGFLGDLIHRSRSRSNFEKITREAKSTDDE